MIGQEKLLNKINQYNIDTFPRSVLFIGDKGCGKHTLAKYISENIIKLPLLDITPNLSDEYIDAIYRNPNPNIYLINMSDFLFEKNQNILLKFIEEPLNNAFIILLAESKDQVLNTILNRCIIFEFEAYTRDQLNEFISSNQNKELILSAVTTPGQILNTNLENINDLIKVVDNIVDNLSKANFANTLTIADKINYKDEYSKFDMNIFLNILGNSLFNKYLSSNNKNMLYMYLLLVDERKKLIDKRLNKQLFIENLLGKLWKRSRA